MVWQPAAQRQMTLDLGIEVERDVGGIEMGVLQNGMPYLTQRGLAGITGAARSSIQEISREWEATLEDPIPDSGRMGFIRSYLLQAGYDEPKLYLEIERNGSPHYAYPEVVCMALIEFYAFEAQRRNDTALENYRRLARYGLQRFIFDALGYQPEDPWRHVHDRQSILNNAAPPGYFIVFNEVTGLAIDLIGAGLTVNDKTIPDLSVGRTWASYWNQASLENMFGDRIQFEHNYPYYYPQADSNPQLAWAYPDAALPSFRQWFRYTYLPSKFPNYILRKADVLSGGKREAEAISQMYQRGELPNG